MFKMERKNAKLEEMLLKTLKESSSIRLNIINAKNSHSNVYGFLPYQPVFGMNLTLPNVFSNRPPAFEGLWESKIVA